MYYIVTITIFYATDSGKAMQVSPDTYDNPSYKDGAVEMDNINGAAHARPEKVGSPNGVSVSDIDTPPKKDGGKDDVSNDDDKDKEKEPEKLVSLGTLVSSWSSASALL